MLDKENEFNWRENITQVVSPAKVSRDGKRWI